MDLKEEALLGPEVARHWYYRAKLSALLGTLADLPPDAVLDVGAGSGFFARSLLERGAATAATCVDPGYGADREEVVAGRPLSFRRQPQRPAPVVLMMDVLEHVPDDAGLLRGTLAGAPPGTRVVVTVPAFGWLWSRHDVFLGHLRRYTLAGIERLLRDCTLRVEFAHYLYAPVLPMVVVQRLGRRFLGEGEPRSDMRRFGRVSNAVLDTACNVERRFARRNRLAGLTVLARAVVV